MRDTKGITLVALIITIIILIILATVTIMTIYNSNFIGVAINSTENYAKEQYREIDMLNSLNSKLDNAVNKINGNNSGSDGDKPGIEDSKNITLQELLINNDIHLEKRDVYSGAFFNKLLLDNNKKDIFVSSEKDVSKIISDNELISKLNLALVPNLSSNTNVIYSTQYDGGSYAGYRAFDNTNNYWCSKPGQVNNAYIGYNMGQKAKVYFASFYNYCSRI